MALKSLSFPQSRPAQGQACLADAPILEGEIPVDGAPVIAVREDVACIPQHFLRYAHTRDTVEAIAARVSCDDHYIPFVCEDEGGVYIQIGIIGRDNYKPSTAQPGRKIVYGRKWRVEPNLPSSEIIQTIFLAIKIAREHECREVFRFKLGQSWVTPFNNHHDLPLLARCRSDVSPAPRAEAALQIDDLLSALRYDHAKFICTDLIARKNGQWIMDLNLIPSKRSHLPEVVAAPSLTILTTDLSTNTVLYALMDAMLDLANRHIEGQFCFDGFARFDRSVDALRISALSLALRDRAHEQSFASEITAERYDTDSTRVPVITDTPYGQFVRKRIAALDIQAGFLPCFEHAGVKAPRFDD